MRLRQLAIAAVLVGGCGAGRPAAEVDAGETVDAAAIDGPPAAPLAVLFVGNSYTYVFDLPAEVAALAPPDAPIVSSSIAIGSATLRNHWEGTARPAIEAGAQDVVVLQGQSLEPLFGAEFATYADLLAGATTAAGDRVVFYDTWARRAGDAFYTDPTSGGTPSAMQDRLTAAYADAADRNGGALAAVGEARRLVLAEHADLDLFDPDGSHPSAAGAYLAACVFVEVLTGEPPTEVERLGLDGATRTILRDAAHRATLAAR